VRSVVTSCNKCWVRVEIDSGYLFGPAGVDAATILGCVVEVLAASEVEMVDRDIKPKNAAGQMTWF